MKANGNGTRRPDEILAEIERTRNDMDHTLGQLERRLTPGQLLDQGMEYLRSSGAADYARNLRGSVRDNPLPVALAGIGLAWLMAADRLDRRRGGDGASSGVEGMKEGLHERSEGMKERAASLRDRATGAMASGRQRLDDSARAARERIEQLRSGYDRVVTEQPLALGAIGLAIGAVMAAALPRTRKEDDLLSGTRETIADKAAELATEAKEKGSEGRRPDMAEVERAQFKAGINGGPNPPISS